MTTTPSLGTCPACGSADILTELTEETEEFASGPQIAVCAVCGYQLGPVPEPAPALEAEPEPLAELSTPGLEEAR